MLHQKRSGKLARLKYLLAIPICGGLLCASTLAFSKTYGWVDIAPNHIYSDNVDPQTHVAKDTDKTHVPPPPPPAPPVKRVTFPLPKPLPNKTAKGYRYSESAYLENGKYDITVTFQEKNGSLKYFSKSTATPADLTLLKDKYGYVFPAHLRMPPTIQPTVHELPATPAQPTVKELPPPPPPAPPKSAKKRYPPPTIFADVPAFTAMHGFPPPPPMDGQFMDLYNYLNKAVRYPLDAKNKHLVANVVVRFSLNSEHKIIDVSIVDAGGNHFDEEVADAVRAYKGTIIPSTKLPYYMVGVNFNLVNDKDNYRAGSFGTDLRESPNYACVVQLNGDMY